MHSRYEYGKDKRSDKKYKLDNYVGKYNQNECIKQYLIEKEVFENRKYEASMHEEEMFGDTDDKIQDYHPDCELITPGGNFWLEIKVQMKPKGEDVHIKQNQVDKLIQLNGYVLYSTQKEYFIHTAKHLKENAERIGYSNKLYKMCYIIKENKVKWFKWQHPPNYMDYYKEYGNYTKK